MIRSGTLWMFRNIHGLLLCQGVLTKPAKSSLQTMAWRNGLLRIQLQLQNRQQSFPVFLQSSFLTACQRLDV